MPTAENIIKTTDLSQARVREIEFVNMFQDSLKKLMECLGITRPIRKVAGTELVQYTASGTLQSGKVAEGEVIPLSKYTIKPKKYKDLTLQKFRKVTTAEAIIKYGFTQAVEKTSDAMLRDAQKNVRTDFVNAVKAGTGNATGAHFQAAVAAVWAQLQIVFEDSAIESVYLVNPEDVGAYLGNAQITTQTAFGFRYIEDFLGMGTVIMLADIPKGEVYGTAKNNLVLYFLDMNDADLGEVFDFTIDKLGLIGMHEGAKYEDMTVEDVMAYAIELFPERPNGIVKGTISGAAAAAV